jgi:hypothetical protein
MMSAILRTVVPVLIGYELYFDECSGVTVSEHEANIGSEAHVFRYCLHSLRVSKDDRIYRAHK